MLADNNTQFAAFTLYIPRRLNDFSPHLLHFECSQVGAARRDFMAFRHGENLISLNLDLDISTQQIRLRKYIVMTEVSSARRWHEYTDEI